MCFTKTIKKINLVYYIPKLNTIVKIRLGHEKRNGYTNYSATVFDTCCNLVMSSQGSE